MSCSLMNNLFHLENWVLWRYQVSEFLTKKNSQGELRGISQILGVKSQESTAQRI